MEKEKGLMLQWLKGKGKAQPQDEAVAGSSRAVSEGSSRKRAREDEDDEDEDGEAENVKKPRAKKGPTIKIRGRQPMGGERICQRCHENGIRCTVAVPDGNATTHSCGPCYKHKKKCVPMVEEGARPQGVDNDGALWALAFAVGRMVGRVERTLDLVDKALLKYIGQPAAGSSRESAENEEEPTGNQEEGEKGSEERADDDMEQD